MRRLFLVIALIASVPMAQAQEQSQERVILGLSQDNVAITTNFDGSELLIFGAVQRETKIPDTPLEVIITIAGPSEPLLVRRKEKRFGIWINVTAARLGAAPSFYAVATSGPIEDILSNVEDVRHSITVPRAIWAVGATETAPDVENFTEALIRIRQKNGLYQILPETVLVQEETLFRTSISLPANLTEGKYATRIFLLRDKSIVASYETNIGVHKTGLEEQLYRMSREQSVLYGILSLVLAVVSGWIASTVFRLLRER